MTMESQEFPFMDAIQKGVSDGRAAKQAAGSASSLISVLVQLTIALTAMWASPLLRTRLGIVSVLVQGPLAVLTLMIAGAYSLPDGPWRGVVFGWSGLLVGALGLHFVLGVFRLFRPGRRHAHSLGMGEPSAPLRPLWRVLMGDWSRYPLRVAIIGEPLLVSALAGIVFVIDTKLLAEQPASPSPAVYLMLSAAGGIFVQAAATALQNEWALQALSDQEAEQTDRKSVV